MIKVLVSGCYDIIHAGHVAFFKTARQFGDHLTVCFADDEVYRAWKHREPALPENSRRVILAELRCVDAVVMSSMCKGLQPYFDFVLVYLEWPFDVLVTTTDDPNADDKQTWCIMKGIRFVQVPRQASDADSTTAIRRRLMQTT